METQNKKILLVEDDPNFGTVLKDYLMMNDYDVVHAKNGMEGFEKFKKDDFDFHTSSIVKLLGLKGSLKTAQTLIGGEFKKLLR